MEIIALVLALIGSLLFLYVFLRRYIQITPVKKYYKLAIVGFVLFSVIPLFNSRFEDTDVYKVRAFLTFVGTFLSINFIFKTNFTTKLFINMSYYLYILPSFLFFSTLFISQLKMMVTITSLNQSIFYEMSYFFAYAFSTFVLIILDKLVIKQKIIGFFKHQRILINLMVIQTFLFIPIIMITNNSVLMDNFTWYNELILTIAAIIFAVHIVAFKISINTGNLSALKHYNTVLKNQLDFQLRHYHKYEEYMQSFAKFKHDHHKITSVLSKMDIKKDYDKILDILKSSESDFDHVIKTYKKYSNNYIVDAVFNEFNMKLNSIGCSISEDTYIPFHLEMEDYDIIRLFFNILQNVYEALCKISPQDREFKITFTSVNDFHIIDFANSTDAKKYSFKTLKPNKILNGHGLTIIEEVVGKYGGTLSKQITNKGEKFYFNLKLFMPYSK